MKICKSIVPAPLAAAIFTAAAVSLLPVLSSANSAVAQDCLLEGVVQFSESRKGVQSIYVEFFSIRQMSEQVHCSFSEDKFEFNGILGSQISNVPPGTSVKYRFTRELGKEPIWQLQKISI